LELNRIVSSSVAVAIAAFYELALPICYIQYNDHKLA